MLLSERTFENVPDQIAMHTLTLGYYMKYLTEIH